MNPDFLIIILILQPYIFFMTPNLILKSVLEWYLICNKIVFWKPGPEQKAEDEKILFYSHLFKWTGAFCAHLFWWTGSLCAHLFQCTGPFGTHLFSWTWPFCAHLFNELDYFVATWSNELAQFVPTCSDKLTQFCAYLFQWTGPFSHSSLHILARAASSAEIVTKN